MGLVVYTESFNYAGFDVPALRVREPLIMNKGMTNIPVYEHFQESCPVKYRVALHSLGRDMKLGKDTGKVPKIVKLAADCVYSHAHSCMESKENHAGAVHRDIAVFRPWNKAPKGMHKPENKKFRFVQYYVDADKAENWNSQIVPVSYERMENIMMPEGMILSPFSIKRDCYFIVPTEKNPGGDCGWYDPVTGMPLDVIYGKENALKRIMEYEGISHEQALDELSSFFMTNKDQSVVPCTYGSTSNGPMSILMDVRPTHYNREYGSYNIRKQSD